MQVSVLCLHVDCTLAVNGPVCFVFVFLVWEELVLIDGSTRMHRSLKRARNSCSRMVTAVFKGQKLDSSSDWDVLCQILIRCQKSIASLRDQWGPQDMISLNPQRLESSALCPCIAVSLSIVL